MSDRAPTDAAIRLTQRFVVGALGDDPATSRRTSYGVLMAVFVPLGILSSLAVGSDRFAAPPSIAGLLVTLAIVVLLATTTGEHQQHRWRWIILLTATAQGLGIAQLGRDGMVLLPETAMIGAWAALYLPTRVVRQGVISVSLAVSIAVVNSDNRLSAMLAVLVAQITIATATLLTHSVVLALRATNDELEDARQLAHVLATTDALTGTANRRSFTQLVHAIAEGPPVQRAVMLVDIDNFKELNDHHGHLVGDDVLKAVSARLGVGIRDARVARWGGEEFAVVAGPFDDEQALGHAAERIREQVAQLPIDTEAGQVSCTVSVGATPWWSIEPFDDALRRADRALYDAKANGRNCAVVRSRPQPVDGGQRA